MRPFTIVVAADLANGIGFKGGLPWRLRKDMAFFARITSKTLDQASAQQQQQHTPGSPATRVNACIMGRRTWESIPPKFRPLSSRFNVIVTRNPHYLEQVLALESAAVALASIMPAPLTLVPAVSNSQIRIDRIFLIGGAQLYNEGVQSKDCAHIFMTRIQTTLECDTFFPEIKESVYKLLPSQESHAFLEEFLQEPVEGGVIEEGAFKYEYAVYNRI
ncbi:dihydrofolate reductase-like domain-containing protein [Gamsiella multidivaricata]|uniref:dihydrofolate reductase-like domain-containing protein n=1 Tax=Gamsiella multidivaricata TaxID=101098 RepID=UPI00221E3BA0|nr:dihydrofolate reductase-like domain-containing protein [Gamsiella multidivaricata]KAI7823641.1 dihydrofolate reductase-like domain-containing protein [Gamsiella multidivaricata]